MIKNMNLYAENGRYFLSVEYRWEDDGGKYRSVIPKVALPFYISDEPSDISHIGGVYQIRSYDMAFDIFKGAAKTKDGEILTGVRYLEETIEEKIHEMTKSEIEKKLGYKIKIVAEEEI